jgi:hypothetical protein
MKPLELESLGSRITPTTLPFGGNLSITTALKGTQFTETILYTAPNGLTVSEVGTFTIDYRTNSVSGSFVVTGTNQETVLTGTVTAEELNASQLDGVIALTGSSGQIFTYDFSIPLG